MGNVVLNRPSPIVEEAEGKVAAGRHRGQQSELCSWGGKLARPVENLGGPWLRPGRRRMFEGQGPTRTPLCGLCLGRRGVAWLCGDAAGCFPNRG